MLKSRRMFSDILEGLQLYKRPNSRFSIDVVTIQGGLNISVTGRDPKLTRDIANFCVTNLDKINEELKITSEKPMVKVLDKAALGTPKDKKIFKKLFAASLFGAILGLFLAVVDNYFRSFKFAQTISEK